MLIVWGSFKISKRIIYNYCIIAQKLVKARSKNNVEFIWTRALSQHSFIQFMPYATLFLGLLLSLKLMSKSKKILETSLDLLPSFKTSVDARVGGLVSNVDYLENRCHNFTQNKYGRTKTSAAHTHFVLWLVIFLFVQTFYIVDNS